MYVPLQERERERRERERERREREREREKTHVFKMVIMRGKALLVECAIKIILHLAMIIISHSAGAGEQLLHQRYQC